MVTEDFHTAECYGILYTGSVNLNIVNFAFDQVHTHASHFILLRDFVVCCLKYR